MTRLGPPKVSDFDFDDPASDPAHINTLDKGPAQPVGVIMLDPTATPGATTTVQIALGAALQELHSTQKGLHRDSWRGIVRQSRQLVPPSDWVQAMVECLDLWREYTLENLSRDLRERGSMDVVFEEIHPTLNSTLRVKLLDQIQKLPPQLEEIPRVYLEVPVEAFNSNSGVCTEALMLYTVLETMVRTSLLHYQLTGFMVDPCRPGEAVHRMWFGLRNTDLCDIAEMHVQAAGP